MTLALLASKHRINFTDFLQEFPIFQSLKNNDIPERISVVSGTYNVYRYKRALMGQRHTVKRRLCSAKPVTSVTYTPRSNSERGYDKYSGRYRDRLPHSPEPSPDHRIRKMRVLLSLGTRSPFDRVIKRVPMHISLIIS